MSYLGSLNSFDHNSQEWEIFHSRLQQFLILNKIVEAGTKSALLLTHLSDETYRLLKNLVHPRDVAAVGYDELLKVLNEHFSPKRCTFADRCKFYEARRDVGESVEQWAARIRGLAVHCEFGSALDLLLTDKFVLGLRAGKERERLFEQDAATLTLAKAMQLAQQMECAQQARASGVDGTVKQEPVYRAGSERWGAGAAAAAGNRDARPRLCSVCGMKSHDASKCRYKTYRCQVCGVKGHLKKVCVSKKPDCPVHNVEAEFLAPEVNECVDCKDCELLSLRS
ncbi:uncharacterized protein [Choristoneura fumiferana]|uniref:uncharacterized protein n=1 Tax=Choristoneura fumiferana TaxID=7141 RepID=UPI003D15892C